MLVPNNPYNGLRLTQPQHRSNEVAAIGAVKPRASEHGRQRMRGQNSSFTGELRGAVDIQRRGNVTFVIRIRFRAVEHIVGREMDEWNVHLPRDICQRRRAIAVDAEHLRCFRFGLIDRRVSGRIDDCRRRDRRDELIDPFAVLQIEFSAPESHRRQTAHCSETTKTRCQLTIPSGNEDGSICHLRLSVGQPGGPDASRHRHCGEHAPTMHGS